MARSFSNIVSKLQFATNKIQIFLKYFRTAFLLKTHEQLLPMYLKEKFTAGKSDSPDLNMNLITLETVTNMSGLFLMVLK